MVRLKPKKNSQTIVDTFTQLSKIISHVAGTPWMFLLALLFVFTWLVSGRYFEYSDTWQLVINTSTTIITFLMVFVIQNAQNRDSCAIELKLDELLKEIPGNESNQYIHIEDLNEEEIKALQKRFKIEKPLKKKK